MSFHDLETERLYLRTISPEDRHFILQQFSNDEVNQYLFDAEPLDGLDGADEIIGFYNEPEPRCQQRWILVRKEDNAPIGTCGFHCWDRGIGRCETGYDLYPSFWGQGYMLEAMQAILDFAREEMKVSQIIACIYSDNKRSAALAERLGFCDSGKTKDEIFRGKAYEHKLYALDVVK